MASCICKIELKPCRLIIGTKTASKDQSSNLEDSKDDYGDYYADEQNENIEESITFQSNLEFDEDTEEENKDTLRSSLDVVPIQSAPNRNIQREFDADDTDEEEESLETPFRSNNRASGRPRINNSKTKSKINRNTAKNTRQRYQIEEKTAGNV